MIVPERTKIGPSNPISTKVWTLWAEKLRDTERFQFWNEHIESILGIPHPQRQYYQQLCHQLQMEIFSYRNIWHQINKEQVGLYQMINFIHTLKVKFILYPCSWTWWCTLCHQFWRWGFEGWQENIDSRY